MPINVPIDLKMVIGVPATVVVTLEIELESKFVFGGTMKSNWKFGAGKAVHLTAVLDTDRLSLLNGGKWTWPSNLLQDSLAYHVEIFELRDVPVIGWMGTSLIADRYPVSEQQSEVFQAMDEDDDDEKQYTERMVLDLNKLIHEIEDKADDIQKRNDRHKVAHEVDEEHYDDIEKQLLTDKDLYVKYKFCTHSVSSLPHLNSDLI